MQLIAYIAEIFVLAGIGSAIVIALDTRSCVQHMRIMRSVWILTGLWASIFGLWAYFAFGRSRRCTAQERASHREGMEEMPGHKMAMPARPRWQSVVLSTLHCGAGCTLADLVGEWLLFFVPVAIGGSLIAGSWVVDYVLALLFGIGFQYAAIRGMEPQTPRGQILRRAAKADVLSLTSWQAGMYGWMAVVIFALNDGSALPRTSFTFWFMMQVAMACGFIIALPVNVLLIRTGIKRGM